MAHHQKLWMTFVKTYTLCISWSSSRLGDSLGISDRGTRAKRITSCDNASATNFLSLALRYTTLSHSRNGNQPHVLLMPLR